MNPVPPRKADLMKPFEQPPYDPHGDERSQEPFATDLPHKAPLRVYGSRRMLLLLRLKH